MNSDVQVIGTLNIIMFWLIAIFVISLGVALGYHSDKANNRAKKLLGIFVATIPFTIYSLFILNLPLPDDSTKNKISESIMTNGIALSGIFVGVLGVMIGIYLSNVITCPGKDKLRPVMWLILGALAMSSTSALVSFASLIANQQGVFPISLFLFSLAVYLSLLTGVITILKLR